MSGMVSSQQQGTAAGPVATVAAAVPAVPPSTVAAAVPAVPPLAYTAAGAALFNFNNPVRLPPALFGNIVVTFGQHTQEPTLTRHLGSILKNQPLLGLRATAY
jgi:hypothetical protein